MDDWVAGEKNRIDFIVVNYKNYDTSITTVHKSMGVIFLFSILELKNPTHKKSITNTSLAAPGALAHRLQRRTACKIKNDRQGPPNGRRGLGRGVPLGFGALPSTFSK